MKTPWPAFWFLQFVLLGLVAWGLYFWVKAHPNAVLVIRAGSWAMLLFPLFVFYLMRECPVAGLHSTATEGAKTRHASYLLKRHRAARKALLFCTVISALCTALAACSSRFCLALAGALLIWLFALLIKIINWLFEIITLSQQWRQRLQAAGDEAGNAPPFAEAQDLTSLACSFKSSRSAKSSRNTEQDSDKAGDMGEEKQGHFSSERER